MNAHRIDDYKNLLSEFFESDNELIEKWHIESGNGLKACINRTHQDLRVADVDFYVLIENNKNIGYFGIEKNTFLTGFFIKPEYRKKECIQMFWNIVNNHFENKPFYCGLYTKNERALNFLFKAGAKVLFRNDNTSLLLELNR